MQWGKHKRSHRLLLHRIMNCSFVLSFPVQILWQVHTEREKRESDSGFVCVFHYRAYVGGCGGGAGVQHTSERNPTWVEWEQRSPRKHWTSKTKHFLWKWIYLLAWLPEGPRQNGFLMGNRATVWGLPKDLHEKHLIWGWTKTVKSFRSA